MDLAMAKAHHDVSDAEPFSLKAWLADARTALIATVLTGAIGVPATLYYAGVKAEADRNEVRRLAEQQKSDHETISRLTGASQSLNESVNLLARDVRQMVPLSVHEAKWSDLDHQLKATNDKIDNLTGDVRQVNQNILRIAERMKP
jgi:methyl-accepting chemotaxis protein